MLVEYSEPSRAVLLPFFQVFKPQTATCRGYLKWWMELKTTRKDWFYECCESGTLLGWVSKGNGQSEDRWKIAWAKQWRSWISRAFLHGMISTLSTILLLAPGSQSRFSLTHALEYAKCANFLRHPLPPNISVFLTTSPYSIRPERQWEFKCLNGQRCRSTW